MDRPRLLDLFCGAGGAAMGYSRAGFDVVGVDIKPQPNYPFEFAQDGASSVLSRLLVDGDWNEWHLGDFDAIHASPPCQAFTAYRRIGNGIGDGYPDLIESTRGWLHATGLPYVIENVQGAPLIGPAMICGSMFDPPMDIQRHRLFETNWPLEAPQWPCRHKLQGPDRFPGGRSKERTGRSDGAVRGTIEVGAWDIPLKRQQEAMGIDWMTLLELSEAIPPAYTEHIGSYLLSEIKAKAAA